MKHYLLHYLRHVLSEIAFARFIKFIALRLQYCFKDHLYCLCIDLKQLLIYSEFTTDMLLNYINGLMCLQKTWLQFDSRYQLCLSS